MPPRHGQSQLISPVSSLKAPSDAASDSVAEGSERGEGVGSSVVGGRGLSVGVEVAEMAAFLRVWATESSVGRDESSVGDVGVRGSSTWYRQTMRNERHCRTHTRVHRQSKDWCCSNRLRPQPGPIWLRCFSMTLILKQVARWKGNVLIGERGIDEV